MQTTNHCDFVDECIENTKCLTSPPNYWSNTLASRQPSGNGSRFHETVTEETLKAVEWEEITDSLPEGVKMPGCRYFQTAIPGLLGVVELGDIPRSQRVLLVDPKGTGKVSAEISREVLSQELSDVDFTVLTVGEEEGMNVVYTFHPGLPIRPSQVPAEGFAGREVTVSEAYDLGLHYAKVNG
jgi:hypothetical protein